MIKICEIILRLFSLAFEKTFVQDAWTGAKQKQEELWKSPRLFLFMTAPRADKRTNKASPESQRASAELDSFWSTQAKFPLLI